MKVGARNTAEKEVEAWAVIQWWQVAQSDGKRGQWEEWRLLKYWLWGMGSGMRSIGKDRAADTADFLAELASFRGAMQ